MTIYQNNIAGSGFLQGPTGAPGPAANTYIQEYEYIATQGQTTFSGNDKYNNPMSYVANTIFVALNGSLLNELEEYSAINGSSLTLNQAASANDELIIYTFPPFTVADTYTQSQANTIFLKLTGGTISGNLNFANGSNFTVPVGNTAQRPTASAGFIRYNTDLGTLESANATAWANVGSGGSSSSTYGANTADTSYFSIPIGTSAQKPANPPLGALRWNTSNTAAEMYVGNNIWQIVSSSIYTVEYLIVGAGGGGGGYLGGGGGGAGGLLNGTTSVIPGTSYSVAIGSGGTGSPSGGSTNATAGGNSSALSQTATGGGFGGTFNGTTTGGNGGSGAGGSGLPPGGSGPGGSGTTGQGNPGGQGTHVAGSKIDGGGGGGASASGTNSDSVAWPSGVYPHGGAGTALSLSGASAYYAGGGGGGGHSSGAKAGNGGAGGGGGGGGYNNAGTGGSNNGANGTQSTTSGAATGGSGGTNSGGGAGGGGGNGGAGGNGGSGFVILRYLGNQRGSGGTVTSSGGYTIHTFTTSATFTA